MKSAAGWSSYQQIPPISDDSGLVHVSAKDRAEVLNAAFARQCSAPSAAHPPRLSTSSSSFAFQPITEESTKALRGVPIRKASGLDDLPARLLFECAAKIAAPLCYVFNLSLSLLDYFHPNGKLPAFSQSSRTKVTAATPCHTDRSPCFQLFLKSSKSLSTVKSWTTVFQYGFIPDQQFGFLPRRSTVWQQLSVIEEWQCALDAGKSVHALFLDVSKAFGRVDHSVLQEKMKSLGFDDLPLR